MSLILYRGNKNKPAFWAITRHHGVEEVPGLVEMDPTGLPKISKPYRTPGICQTCMFDNPNTFRKKGNTFFASVLGSWRV